MKRTGDDKHWNWSTERKFDYLMSNTSIWCHKTNSTKINSISPLNGNSCRG